MFGKEHLFYHINEPLKGPGCHKITNVMQLLTLNLEKEEDQETLVTMIFKKCFSMWDTQSISLWSNSVIVRIELDEMLMEDGCHCRHLLGFIR